MLKPDVSSGEQEAPVIALPRVLKLKRLQDYFTNPQPCDAINEVRRKMQEELEGLIDPATLRAMQDWSYLNDKEVGAEDLTYSI